MALGSAGVKQHHSFPIPSSKALDSNPGHSKCCHQTNHLWRLIQHFLLRSFSFKWMKFLWEPRKFIKELYLSSRLEAKIGLTHERVKHRGLLRVSLSCHFVCDSQRAGIAQTFPLIPVSRGSKPSSSVLSLDADIILSVRKPFCFPDAEITLLHLSDNFSLLEPKE